MRGITRFICGVHDGLKNQFYSDISRKLRGYEHELFCSYEEEFNGERDADSQDKIRKEVVGAKDWYVVADLDEFHYHSGFQHFCQMQQAAEEECADYISSDLIDRLPRSGRLTGVDPKLSLDEQFPFGSHLTKHILRACTEKVALAKGGVPIMPGHHFAIGKPASFKCVTHHFKWHGEDLIDRLTKQAEAFSAQGLYYSNEPSDFVMFYCQGGDKFDLENPQLGVFKAGDIGI